MHTRREAIVLAAAASLLTENALGQEDVVKVLFDDASGKLRDPTQVQQLYVTFGFYVQLLELSARLSPDKKSAARKTYLLLGGNIRNKKETFNAEYTSVILPELRTQYTKSRQELLRFLHDAGIEDKSLANHLIEISLIAMMLYQTAASGVTKVSNLLFCCWPFCFKQPT